MENTEAMEVFGFGETTPTETEVDTVAPAETPANAEQEQPEQSANVQTAFKIKYNGEELDIPIEEAKLLAQKGKNYDKKVEAYDHLKSEYEGKKPYLDFLFERASKAGITPEQYIQQIKDADMNSEAEQLATKDPTELAKELVLNKQKLQEFSTQAQTLKGQLTVQEQAKSREMEMQKQWDEFSVQFPEFKSTSELPPEVWQATVNGTHPVQAMKDYKYTQMQEEVKQLKEKTATLERSHQAGAKSSGSMRDTVQRSGEKDEALDVYGF